MELFCKKLPKIELHAHLNGSLSINTFKLLEKMKNKDADNNRSEISDYKIDNGDSCTLDECFALFTLAHNLTDTPEAVKLATLCTLQEFHDDGVIYLELRSTPQEKENITKIQYIQAIIDGILESSNRISMKTCLLLSIDRRKSLHFASETVHLAIEMAMKYPNIVLGIDLSGDPKFGKFSDFAKIMHGARNAGLKVTIHAGEKRDEIETLEILDWKPDRLGHMTCSTETMLGNKNVWNATIESKIPIELCLTSNLKCRCIPTYDSHHFKEFYKANHPISLATDDKGVFNTSLSKEFEICAKTFKLTKQQLWNISFNTIDQCFSNEEVKKSLREKLYYFKNKEMSNEYMAINI